MSGRHNLSAIQRARSCGLSAVGHAWRSKDVFLSQHPGPLGMLCALARCCFGCTALVRHSIENQVPASANLKHAYQASLDPLEHAREWAAGARAGGGPAGRVHAGGGQRQRRGALEPALRLLQHRRGDPDPTLSLPYRPAACKADAIFLQWSGRAGISPQGHHPLQRVLSSKRLRSLQLTAEATESSATSS